MTLTHTITWAYTYSFTLRYCLMKYQYLNGVTIMIPMVEFVDIIVDVDYLFYHAFYLQTSQTLVETPRGQSWIRG